jgi:hypothetical protein
MRSVPGSLALRNWSLQSIMLRSTLQLMGRHWCQLKEKLVWRIETKAKKKEKARQENR